MRFGNKYRYNYYLSLDTLPIYNWYKLHKQKDLKYLLILDNYDQKVKIRLLFRSELQKHLETLFYEFDELNLPVLRAKRDIIVRVLELFQDIFMNSKDIEKIEKAGTILSALMITDAPDMNWLFQIDFTETNDQKRFLTEIGIAINRFNKKSESKKDNPEQSLNEKKVKIESLLGVNIDTRKCSVMEFQAYEKEAIEKIKTKSKIYQ